MGVSFGLVAHVSAGIEENLDRVDMAEDRSVHQRRPPPKVLNVDRLHAVDEHTDHRHVRLRDSSRQHGRRRGSAGQTALAWDERSLRGPGLAS